jgi:four helix bundle protein
MALIVAQLSIELVEALRPLVLRIRRHDRSLADQLVRAASSVALNIAEGEHSDPGNRRARFYSVGGERE